MADIAPFYGICYDPTKVELAQVIAPPYDVIDATARERLAADAHNFVHLDLPKLPDSKGAATARSKKPAAAKTTTKKPSSKAASSSAPPKADTDVYGEAASKLTEWLASGELVESERRAIYRYQQTFADPSQGGRIVSRRGFYAALKLTPFSDGMVRPHEKTLAAPKADRLALLRATQTHLSPVFMTFRDAAGEVDRLLDAQTTGPADLDVTDGDGVRHRVWRCDNAELFGALRRVMAPKKVYILDGHHRYDTMLAYRDELAELAPLAPYASANYGLVCLVPMHDPGLLVLPTHRLIHGVEGLTSARMLAVAAPWFTVDRVVGGAKNLAAVQERLAEAGAHAASMALLFPDDAEGYILTLLPTVNLPSLGIDVHPVVAQLEVSVLHALLLERGLGITADAQAAQENLRYVKDLASVTAALADGTTQVAVLLLPTPLEKVIHVADLGLVMPQKSTYFVPKLASGLVMAKVDPDRDLI